MFSAAIKSRILSCLILSFLFAITCFAQGPQAEPSRKERLERDGIIWGSATAWSTPFAENIGEDAKIAGLSRFWMEVKLNFPNFAMVPDLDWDQTFVDFIPKVRATQTTYEYYRVLERMCSLLKDGHTNVFLPRELDVAPPIRIDLIERRVFITGVESKALEASGVVPGLEILKIDGIPVHEYAAANRRPYVTSSSPQHVEVFVYSYGLLSGPRDQPVSVELKAKDGKVFVKQIARTKYVDETKAAVFEYRKLPGNIAYVAINTFDSEDAQKEFEKYLPEIRQSDGMVLDVRKNDGGSGVIAYNIIGYLTNQDFIATRWKSRQYVATLRVWGNPGGWFESKPMEWPAKPNDFYSKPVVLLIGPRCLSATDVFVEAFSRLKRGRIVGEPTGGSTGDPLPFKLPGGGSARVATSANIGFFQPDVFVSPTAASFLAGTDLVLEAGEAELRKLIRP